jgi:hypothetical protein
MLNMEQGMKIAANRIASELVIKSTRWGNYARVAVLRVPVGAVPKAINEQNVFEIVEIWEKRNVGAAKPWPTARCGYGQALAEARKLAPNAREIDTLRGHRL